MNEPLRTVPHSIHAEQSVLGTVLIDPKSMALVAEMLHSEDFYLSIHQSVYQAMLELFQRNEPIDPLTVLHALNQNLNEEESDKHYVYISELMNAPDYIVHVSQYIDIVREHSIRRKLITISQEIAGESYEGEKDVTQILELAESKVFQISQATNQKNMVSIREVIDSAYSNLVQVIENKGHLLGASTGFIDLDKITNGFQKSDLILVAARPAMGKTALTLNLAVNIAMQDKQVLLFNLEMSKEQLSQRMIASEAQINLQDLKTGKIKDEQWPDLIHAMNRLSQIPMHIDDTPGNTVTAIRSKCRQHKMRHGLDLVVIDYLQLMESDRRGENRQQEIAKISRSLKILAKELDCPVVALSQLSRMPETRAGNHRPILSDLRESGAIEQDADIVMFLYRDEVYNKETDLKGVAELIIAKHRNGEIGTIYLGWFGGFQQFRDLEMRHVDSDQ